MDSISTFGTLLLFSITIFLGYFGSLIFVRTRIPDVILLMSVGLLISYSGFIDRNMFLSISPLFSAIALIIVLFDAGLDMDFYHTLHGFPRSIILAVLGMILSMLFIGALSVLIFKLDLISGLLLGAILSGTSAPIVMSIMNQLKINEKIKIMLNLESIIGDPLSIIVSITLLHMIISNTSVSEAAQGIASAFSVGAITGLISGILWLFVLDHLKGKQFDYMLTLAFLFAVYASTELLLGSGAIASLMFGVVLGSGNIFSGILKLGKQFSISDSMKMFHKEVSFFIRSFFFMYIGLIVAINSVYIVYGLITALVLILMRVVLVEISTFRMNLEKSEINIMKIMVPQGLATAVLAQLPAVYGLKNADFFYNIAFIVIIATVVYSSIALVFFYKPSKESRLNSQTEVKSKIS